jgi:serine/threonine-protein kinase PpkA
MLAKGISLGRYTVERSISNSGGTASVYLGHVTKSPKLKVALKIANSANGQPTEEDILLRREAELLSSWDWRHQGIVRLFPVNQREYVVKALNLGEEPWFMAMEYLSGNSLSENMDKIKGFPLNWKIELFYNILLSVAFMHQKGYAHRDLKPENIVFKKPINEYESPQPVLIDFALAWNGTDDIDYVKTSYTLAYASPERILKTMGYDYNSPIWAADIWSLGIIFYEIITGENLLKGSADQIKTTIIKSKLRVELPDNDERNTILVEFIREMLSSNPDDRPSIDLLLRAIEVKFPPPRIESIN